MSCPIKESSVYLRHIVDAYAGGENSLPMRARDVFVEWPKLELEKRGEGIHALDHIRIERSLNMITTRADCADFVLPAFLSILYRYKDSSLLTPEILETYKQAVLGFKYARSLWDFGEFLHIYAKIPQVQSDTSCPRLLGACGAVGIGTDTVGREK
jgi:hypothetical protein